MSMVSDYFNFESDIDVVNANTFNIKIKGIKDINIAKVDIINNYDIVKNLNINFIVDNPYEAIYLQDISANAIGLDSNNIKIYVSNTNPFVTIFMTDAIMCNELSFNNVERIYIGNNFTTNAYVNIKAGTIGEIILESPKVLNNAGFIPLNGVVKISMDNA